MIETDELAEGHPAGCREHLAAIETDLLAMGKGEAKLDEERISRVLPAVHKIGRAAAFFGLVKARRLAQHIEDALAKVGSTQMVLNPSQAGVLLGAACRLKEMTPHSGIDDQADIDDIVAALAALPAEPRAAAERRGASAAGQAHPAGGPMRTLLVEDDFSSRLLLQTFLSRYGECHVAVDGKEAVDAFRAALDERRRYDLVCMDIMMPEMDGREAVRQIRAMEEAQGILPPYGSKIVMTTAVDDFKSVAQCFQDLCDAYLVKPIDLAKLLSLMKSYQLAQ